MEARIASLESNVSHLQEDMASVKADVRDLRDRMTAVEVKIDHLPGKGFIVTALVATLAVIAGLVAFADQMQTLLAP